MGGGGRFVQYQPHPYKHLHWCDADSETEVGAPNPIYINGNLHRSVCAVWGSEVLLYQQGG